MSSVFVIFILYALPLTVHGLYTYNGYILAKGSSTSCSVTCNAVVSPGTFSCIGSINITGNAAVLDARLYNGVAGVDSITSTISTYCPSAENAGKYAQWNPSATQGLSVVYQGMSGGCSDTTTGATLAGAVSCAYWWVCACSPVLPSATTITSSLGYTFTSAAFDTYQNLYFTTSPTSATYISKSPYTTSATVNSGTACSPVWSDVGGKVYCQQMNQAVIRVA